jgi:hypothetical protein
VPLIPLDLDAAADPARRRAVVSGLDFDTAVQMHGAFAVLVIAEGLQGQRQQRRAFLGKHRRHLPLGGAVNAGVGPALFPPVQVCLGLFQAFETQSLQGCPLGVADAGFHFPFSIRISDAARERDHAVVCEHVAVERIQRGIVDVRGEHAFAQVVEHHHVSNPAEPAKCPLVQFDPDTRTGVEGEQAYRLAAVAQRQHEQPRALIAAAGRVADHRAAAVVHLRFFAGWCLDYHTGLRRPGRHGACLRSA